jgi:DNA topoisomerase-1
MAIAQQLYEGIPIGQEGNLGLITYMRTDSTHVARQVLDEARLYIKNTYGPDFLPPHARVFTTAVKGAQEAHEAIRPTSINRRPESIKPFLNINQFKLYQLIWQRMVASQMAAARYENTTVDIEAKTNDRNKYLLKSNSSVNVFTGFLALYVEARDEAEEETGTVLPPLDTNEALDLVSTNAQQRFTKPPSRYTEATLIKELEANGIGRPSTYAPTISTIIEREYVSREKNQLKPTDLGIVVNNFLVEYFPEIVNVEFTANMEGKLDGVAAGNQKWTEVVAEFYQPLSQKLEQVEQYARKINPPAQETGQNCPKCSKPLVVKVGRFGKFLCHPEYPDVNELGCKHTSSYQIKTGIICPECQQGEIVEKWNSKKKHAFYGCSRYPECKLATNFKPLATPCPQCGGMMTEYRIKWSVCQKCGHKAKLETNERSI